MGLGGGIIMVPAMVFLLGMSQHKSQGTSLLVIIATATIGASLYASRGHMDLNIALWIGIGSFFGGYFGSFFAGKLSEKTLKLLYAVLMVAVGVKCFF